MHSTNLVGVPTALLASTVFNAHPIPLSISGTREFNPGLFRLLRETASPEHAADVFQHYMALLFGLEQPEPCSERPRRYRSSYLRLLEGWAFDANSPQGAVLKGWVESRFGLIPNFHGEKLGRYPSAAWMSYVEQKMNSRFHNNSINLQLDLLYEFCQWSLARFRPGKRHFTLYRGVNRWEEVEGDRSQRGHRNHFTMRANNLVSFTETRQTAGEFGDWIMEAQVPAPKVLFFRELLPRHALKVEAEWLVLGGDYEVTAACA